MGNILKIFFILTALVFFTNWSHAGNVKETPPVDSQKAEPQVQANPDDPDDEDDVDRQIAEVEAAQSEAPIDTCKATKHRKCKSSTPTVEERQAEIESLEFSTPAASQAKTETNY
jgi:hypothetical protein